MKRTLILLATVVCLSGAVMAQALNRCVLTPEQAEKMKLLRQFRATGQGLTEQEANAMIDCFGPPKNHPKFVTRPVCVPEKPEDVCALKDRWGVLLMPSVISNQVKQTIDGLLAKYGGQLLTPGIIDDSFYGATFGIEASETVVKAISEDPVVRYVYQVPLLKR